MKRFLLALVTLGAMATAADAGPLRRIAARVHDRPLIRKIVAERPRPVVALFQAFSAIRCR